MTGALIGGPLPSGSAFVMSLCTQSGACQVVSNIKYNIITNVISFIVLLKVLNISNV